MGTLVFVIVGRNWVNNGDVIKTNWNVLLQHNAQGVKSSTRQSR